MASGGAEQEGRPGGKSSGIEDYAAIGNGRSVALISRAGSVDWLCWPRFDSPSLFAAILDPDRGGRWRIAPVAPFRVRRRYAADSNVLVTTYETAAGAVELTDLMTVASEAQKRKMLIPEHELLRVVKGLHGQVELELLFRPRPNYGRDDSVRGVVGPLGVRLEGAAGPLFWRGDEPSVRWEQGAGQGVGRFTVRGAERRSFSLTFDPEGPAVFPPLGAFSEQAVERTTSWWREWGGSCSYRGRHQEQVRRSLLVLKLLSYAPSGAIVAAPTTSLPEKVGGELNWDYRFCWLRDASLTVRALFDLGHVDEATAFVAWLLHGTRLSRPELRVLYDVHGETPRAEEVLHHLAGYRNSRPVRRGNAAAAQLQLDTYGEVIDAVARLCRRGLRLDGETRAMLRQFGGYVCENWHRPDQGIWEPRGAAQHYTHSRVVCWAALDRLLELHRAGELPGAPAARFAEHRQRIRDEVEGRAWNPRLRSYTQILDGESVDASLLLLPWYGYLPADHPRMRDTFEKIRERLRAGPGLLYRNETSAVAGEGAFGICSFWAVEYLARGGGTLADAEEWFERLLAYGNDLGLFAEEIHPTTGEPLGNFPQAFTHVGLISAALALEERRTGAGSDPGPRSDSNDATAPVAPTSERHGTHELA